MAIPAAIRTHAFRKRRNLVVRIGIGCVASTCSTRREHIADDPSCRLPTAGGPGQPVGASAGYPQR